MFTRTAFISMRTPPVPEAFPKSANSREKEKEEHKMEGEQKMEEEQKIEDEQKVEEEQPFTRPLLPVYSETWMSPTPIAQGIALRPRSGDRSTDSNSGLEALYLLAEKATSRRTRPISLDQTIVSKSTEAQESSPRALETESEAKRESSIATGKHYLEDILAVQEPKEFQRDRLCIKWGEKVWNDIEEVTIYTMFDIEHSDEAMIIRVKDLLGPGISGDDVMLGEPFFSDNIHGIAILDDEAICAVLVDKAPGCRAKVRVGERAKLKPHADKYPIGYDIVDTEPHRFRGSHVMIVKRGQATVIEGRAIIRLFVRVPPGTAENQARLLAADAYDSRKVIFYSKNSTWQDHFARKGK